MSFSAQILTLVIAQRQRIIEEMNKKDDDDGAMIDDDPDLNTVAKMKKPSSEALSKISDYCKFFYIIRTSTMLSVGQ
jgi:replication fork protection complex subunit Tof1/Swi1